MNPPQWIGARHCAQPDFPSHPLLLHAHLFPDDPRGQAITLGFKDGPGIDASEQIQLDGDLTGPSGPVEAGLVHDLAVVALAAGEPIRPLLEDGVPIASV
jgi:hypothetical protein